MMFRIIIIKYIVENDRQHKAEGARPWKGRNRA